MEAFKIKNGISAKRYLGSNGADGSSSEPYSLAGASYESKSFSVNSQDTGPRDISFNNDGTKMYVVGGTNDTIYQYTLSTAFDVATASYATVSFSVASQETTPHGIAFNSTGTKMYVVGSQNNSVSQYTLSTAFDLSTASYDSVSFSVTSQDTDPSSLAFNNDGTKMYVVGFSSTSVHQYTLSTGFDLSTASYDSVSFSVTSQESGPAGLTFSNDGTKMYVTGFISDSIHQYSLSTAFDLSTASYDSVSFDATPQDSNIRVAFFKPDGTKMYVLGVANNTIYQYSTVLLTQTLDLSTGTTFSFTPSGATTVSFTNPPATGTVVAFSLTIGAGTDSVTWPSSVKWEGGSAPTRYDEKDLYVFVTTDGGTTYYGKKAAEQLA